MSTARLKQVTLFAIIIVLILILSILLANSPVKGSTNVPVKHYITVTVNVNDTLWDIAKQYANTNYYDINAYIEEVAIINSIQDNKIYAGNSLMLPIVE